MESQEFTGFLSGVASRLRHDLKGGLITLRMGLEALPDEEDLKPLLVERARALETLSDKLVLLLRMGEMRPEAVRLSALLGEFRNRLRDNFPGLELTVSDSSAGARPRLDGDALLYALTEIAENASLAGAQNLSLQTAVEPDLVILTLTDNGDGPHPADAKGDLSGSLLPLGVSRWGRSGLGLSIAARCARGHGGELRLEKAGDRGFRVVMLLRVTS